MSLLHHLISRRTAHLHAWHHRHHGRGHPGHDFQDTSPSDRSALDHRARRAARLLNLDAVQLQHLGALIGQLAHFRTHALRGEALQDLSALLQDGDLDRASIQGFVDRRIAQLQQGLPDIVQALGDFLDALNADQRHTVKVLLRMLASRVPEAPATPAAPQGQP